MDPCSLSLGVTALANAVACRLDDAQLGLLALILTQLGDTLATIAAGRACCCDRRLDCESQNRRCDGSAG